MARLIRIVCLIALTVLLGFTANKLRWMMIVRGFIPGGNVQVVQLTDKAVIKGKLGQAFWVAWNHQDIYVPSSSRLNIPRPVWQTLGVGDQLQIVSFKDGAPYLRGGHVSDQELILHAVLLSVLVTLLAILLYFELKAHRLRKIMRSHLAETRDEAGNGAKGLNSTSIYSVPKTKEQWGGRKTARSSRHAFSRRHHRRHMRSNAWNIYVNVIAILWIVIYSFLALGYTALLLFKGVGMGLVAALLWTLMLFVITASVGIFKRRHWGQSFGYALCVLHLIVFPVGTLFGLLMLVGLTGVRDHFK